MSSGIVIPPEGTFLGDFARISATDSEAHEAGYLGVGVAMMSVLLGPKLYLQWTPTHSERCHVWVMLVGQSALSKRSTIQSALRHGLDTAHAFGAEFRMGQVGRVSDAGICEMLDASYTDEESGETRVPSTPTGVIAVMPEMVTLLGGGRGQAYTESARNMLLAVYDGTLRSDTKMTKVPEQPVSATFCGNITEAQFDEVLASATMTTSGFLGRWVPIMVPVSGRLVAEPLMDATPPGTDAKLTTHLRQLARLARAVGPDVNAYAKTTEEARALRREWYESFHPDAGAGWDGVPQHKRERLSQLWSRWQATQLKLAALHAISRRAEEMDTLADLVIERADLEWGMSTMGYVRAQVERTLDDSPAETIEGRLEDRILAFIGEQGGPVRIGDITEHMKHGNKSTPNVTRKMVRQATDGLVDAGTLIKTGEAGRSYEVILSSEVEA